MLKSRLNYTDSVPLWAGFSLSFLDLRDGYVCVPPDGGLGGVIEVSGFKKNVPRVKVKDPK